MKTNMTKTHCCGPNHHKAFFESLYAVFRQFPEEGKLYTINCIDHETDLMKIDFDKQVGIRRIEGKKIVTEFVDRATFEKAHGLRAGASLHPTLSDPVLCCGGDGHGGCKFIWA